MNQEERNEFVKKAIKEAIKERDEQLLKEKKKKAFQNTRLLMKNYNAFKFCALNGVSEVDQLEKSYDENDDVDDRDILYIDSIRRSKMKSLIMVCHIEKCMKQLEEYERQKGTIEKYLTFRYYFIDEMSYESIAEVHGTATITARRWVNELLNLLGVYLFGVDALKI